MGLASFSLDMIRSVFGRDNRYPQAPNLRAGTYGSYGMQPGNEPGPVSQFNSYILDNVQLKQDLMSRYADYEAMSEYPEVGAALNILADEATQQDIITGRSVWVKSPDETIEVILNDTFHKRLELEDHLWEIAHDTAQYGNDYEELIVQDKVGVIKMINTPTPMARRIEDKNGILYGYVSDQNMGFSLPTNEFMKRLKDNSRNMDPTDPLKVYEPWEMVHFRLRGAGRNGLYGISSIDAARWAWKRLSWMEDAMVLYKLTRSPQRYVFYVDVGDVPPNEAKKILNNYKNDFKKSKTIDPVTGKMSFKFNPLSADEDFFVAKRKEKRSTEIDVLSGLDGQQVEDAEYFRNKLISAMGIPKAYLGYDETIGRANLGQMDMRFAKTVMRLQREMKNGLRHIAQVDLAARNIDPDQCDFEVKMVIPSGALEVAHLEVLRTKADLAGVYKDLEFSRYFIWSTILGLTDDEISKVLQQKQTEEQGSPVEAESINKKIDQARGMVSSKEKERANQILERIEQGATHLDRRIGDLKGLTNEIKQSVSRNHENKRRVK